MNTLDYYQLKNGMTLLGENVQQVHSVSFQFMLPAGAAMLPEGCCGAGSVISNWLFRGAGERNSRQLISALDALGIHWHTNVTAHHLTLSASLESSNLAEAIDLFGDIILRPQLAEEQFKLSQQLALGELIGLDDDPRQKTMILLNEQFYPAPWGRPAIGKKDDLEHLPFQKCREIAQKIIDPSRIIFSIAGNYDFNSVRSQLETIFESASGSGLHEKADSGQRQSYAHHPGEGAQVHIGLMTPAPVFSDESYYDLAAAVSVLSGSMSSRLFTEVREKRGLCYAVGAKYKSLRDHAGISCYAGTTPDKAQETLDVILEQFHTLKDGISEDEMQRARVGLKTSLIMHSESSSSRAAGIAMDYFMLDRVRPLDEIRDRIERLSVKSVLRTLEAHPLEDFTVVTLGAKSVTV